MKEEDKKLLLIDLSARLPYGVKIKTPVGFDTLEEINSDGTINLTYEHSYELEEIKPYLFPMSSMTEEQELEFDNMECDYFDNIYGIAYSAELNWLNKNHFDYRNLIKKSLALDATNLNIY